MVFLAISINTTCDGNFAYMHAGITEYGACYALNELTAASQEQTTSADESPLDLAANKCRRHDSLKKFILLSSRLLRQKLRQQ